MMRGYLKQSLSFTLLSSLLLLSGCGHDNSDLKRYIHDVKARPARPIEPIPVITPLPMFAFPEQLVRRSPFLPVVEKSQGDATPDRNRPKEPLEAFPLDALKYVGMLKRGSTTWALITEPDGSIAHIKRGGYMGQNYGRVVAIKKDTVLVEETVMVGSKWVKNVTKLPLNSQK